jgi:type IV pilus assembly protein PilQ
MRFRSGVIAIALLGVATAAHARPTVVRSVEVSGHGDEADVRIAGSFAVPTYAVRARDGGRVVVVDLADASLQEGAVETHPGSALVARTVTSTTARGVRIEVKLARPATYHARAGRGFVSIRFSAMGDDQRPSADSPASPSPNDADGPPTVRNVHLERRDGRDRVVVELSAEAPFRVVRQSSGPARLEIRGARVSSGARRQLEGSSETDVKRVSVRRSKGRVVVEAERPGQGQGTAIREGNRIVWLFAPPDMDDGRPSSRTIAREQDYRETETTEVAGFLSDVPMQVRGARGRRRYSGRRIDLDFKDADIHNILRLLAEVGGVNVVTSDDVSGSVTIRMRNVPWDQALDVILQAKSLGMVRRGNLIRVAPMSTLEKEREAAIARRKQQEQLAPLETRLIPVSYADAEALRPRAKELLSDRGSVSVDSRTNVLIVRDIVENLDDIEELIRTLDTETPQVLIEARIVEATSQYQRDVGIQWGGDVAYGTATGNPTGLVFPSNVSVAGGNFDNQTPTQGLSPFTGNVATPNFAVNLPAITGTGQGGAIGLALGSVGGNVNLNVRLSAAEASGTVRIISSPRILTLDNHEANIAQGTLIPFSQVSAQGVNTAFQEAKLELQVKPHVTSDGSVAMHVQITRDEPDFTRTSPRGDPTILKREAETDLLIDDGHTAVIGGIYTRNTGRNVNQVPFFGDIPLLGVLFQRRVVRDDRNELLIFLTPRIVNRAEALPEG